MITVRWALLAQEDFARIDACYRDIDPDIAHRIGQRILAATALLCEMPLAGPVAARGDRRKWQVARTPYIIFYRVVDGYIRILRLLHGVEEQRLK